MRMKATKLLLAAKALGHVRGTTGLHPFRPESLIRRGVSPFKGASPPAVGAPTAPAAPAPQDPANPQPQQE